MATRMEKYSRNNSASSRSNRNKDLYNDIYTYSKYSNIEGIAEIEKSNQVDITKVKELLESRENYQKQRKYRRLTSDYEEPEKEDVKVTRRFPELEEKNYDIRDVLKEARENKEPDDRERVLRNTQYNILKNIDLKKEVKKEDYTDDEDDLKELIQTIHNNSVLNQTAFTSTDLLSDLKADDTKVGELDNIKELIDQSEMNDQTEVKSRKVSTDDTSYDRSFFTSSLKLSKSDFVGGERKIGIFSKIIITLLIIAMIGSAAILIMKMFFEEGF